MAQATPTPTIEQFYKACAEGKLLGVRCKKCGTVLVPPRSICPNCNSAEFEPTQLKGDGTLQTFTIIHVAPPQFTSLIPYAVGIVQLSEGPKISGIIKGIAKPEELKIGMKMTIDFDKTIQQTWPQWPRYFFKKA